MSVGVGADPSLLTVSPQVTIINSAVGCHYFPQSAVNFTAEEHHCALASTNLYCLVTEVYGSEQLG